MDCYYSVLIYTLLQLYLAVDQLHRVYHIIHWMNGILYVIMGSTVDLIHWATIPGVGY